MTDYKQLGSEVLDDIIKTDFYVDRFIHALAEYKMTTEGVRNQEYSDYKIISLFDTFWALLPDTPSIRTKTFFKVCDIAEGVFDDTVEEDQ